MHVKNKHKIATNFHFYSDASSIVHYGRLSFFSKSGRKQILLLLKTKNLKLIFNSNPSLFEYCFIGLLKTLSLFRIKVVYFDVILKPPKTTIDNYIAKLKGAILGLADKIIVLHKDTSGYVKYYKLDRELFHYIPFKANNIDVISNFDIQDEGYILSLGGSQRDYTTLAAAVDGESWPVVVSCPRASVEMHGALFPDSFPDNVKHIDESVDADRWNELIANSKFVVVPVRGDALQAAGVSVYLEAMAFKKACIVTRGASTIGILDERNLAVEVSPGNADDLRSAINALWNDAKMRESLEKRGYEYALSLGGDKRLRMDILTYLEKYNF